MDISEILSSLTPDDINKLKDVASTFMGEQKNENEPSAKSKAAPDTDIFSAAGNFTSDDERTALIKALKPLLSENRKKKADEAVKILRLMRLIPLLRESGILNNLL